MTVKPTPSFPFTAVTKTTKKTTNLTPLKKREEVLPWQMSAANDGLHAHPPPSPSSDINTGERLCSRGFS